MQKYLKEIIVAVVIAVITGAFTKISFLETEVSMLKQSRDAISTDVIALKKSRESLSDYYVTRREFNAIVKDLKDYNAELKADINKRFDKIEDIIINKK